MYFRLIKLNFPFIKGEGKRRKLSFPSTVDNFRYTFRSPQYSFIASYDAKNELIIASYDAKNELKTSASVSSGVPNTEKLMKARGRRPSAFIVLRCLEPHEARVFDMASQMRQ